MSIQETAEKKEQVILAGVHTGRIDRLNDTDEISLKELEELNYVKQVNEKYNT